MRSALSASISKRTDVYVGGRWQRLLSNIGNDYHEAAAFVGLRHVFR
jgi:predicted porin